MKEISENKSLRESKYGNHSMRAFARYSPDTTWRFSYDGRFKLDKNTGAFDGGNSRYRADLTPVQDGTSWNTDWRRKPSYNHSASVERSFKSKWVLTARNEITVGYGQSNREQSEYLRYFLSQDDIIDQGIRTFGRESNTRLDNSLNLQIPIRKDVSIDLFGKYQMAREESEEDILRRIDSEGFVERNDVSNNRGYDVSRVFYGTNMRAKLFKKLNLTVGIQYLDMNTTYTYFGKREERKVDNNYWLSNFSLSYKGLYANYSKSVQSPSFYYIVAVDANLNPNYMTYASPFFENGVENRYGLRYYRNFKKAKINFNGSINYTIQNNSIGRSRTYDVESAYSTNQNYQTGMVSNSYALFDINKSFVNTKDWKFSWAISIYGGFREQFDKMNEEENKSLTYNGRFLNNFHLTFKDKFTFSPNYEYSFRETQNSGSKEYFPDFSDAQHEVGGTFLWNNFYKFRLETSYNLKNQRKNLANDREQLHIINASIYYPVFKKGELKLTAFDVLNQNRSIYSYSSGNSNTYNITQTLRQYFMLGIVYKFLSTSTK